MLAFLLPIFLKKRNQKKLQKKVKKMLDYIYNVIYNTYIKTNKLTRSLTMTNLLLLLQAGNKKAKQLRDENQKIYEFLQGGEFLGWEELIGYGFDSNLLDVFGIYDGCSQNTLKEEWEDFKDDEEFDEFIKEHDIAWDHVENFFSELRSKKSNNLWLIQNFYHLKHQVVMNNCQPLEVHQSQYFKIVWDAGDEDYSEHYDFFVLFEKDGFRFHVPARKVREALGDDVVDNLPTTESIQQISSNLNENHPYAHLSLEDIIEEVKKLA